jgi:hypothetical protein
MPTGAFRRVRPYLVGVVGGALLMAGGQALADIPDATPSAPDSAHTLYLCVRQGTAAMHAVNVLDKSQGTCATGWDEKQVVPAIPGGTP